MVRVMDITEKITQMVVPSLDAMGYHIVQIKLADSAKRKTLTLMSERKDGVMMSFDDCTEISRTVSALLDVEDPIAGAYNLEVCSPGIDRPLTRAEDYTRYKGFEAKLETLIPIEGRKRFKGKINGLMGGHVQMHTEQGQDVEIPLSNIRTSKLVMTDELVKAFLKDQKKKKA